MAKIHIETHEVGHILEIQGSQEDVTMLLAMAILGSERLNNVILDAIDGQEYLKKHGLKALPVQGVMMDIDADKTTN